jgi:predicted Zn-dependent protease
LPRLLPLSAALVLALATSFATAQESKLPDIGSSAGELLSPKQEREYGSMMLAQLRHYDYTLEDPLVSGWLESMGSRLAANSDKPRQPFTFFMMRDRQINAFATIGGYVGMNTGLVLAAEREDEVAAVLSHEIAHVTQQHVLRAVERAQRDQIPLLLAMLGAIAIANSSSGESSDDATQAVITGAMALAQQRQIDYTRSNEAEADRLGIQTLNRSSYDTAAMADFFEKLNARSRTNRAGYFGETPDYLMSHPVTTTRIGEAKERAEQMARAPAPFSGQTGASDNPLLPSGLTIGTLASGDSGRFEFARERIRVLSADSPTAAIREYEQMGRTHPASDGQRYGLAVARIRAGQAGAAESALVELLERHPGDRWLSLALGEAQARAGKADQADARFDALLRSAPHDRAIALTYARVLSERNSPAAGKRAQAVLRPLLGQSGEDPEFQEAFGRASEIAGDPVRAGEAYAEAAYLKGRPEQALVQLNTLKKREDLDYYARARIDARIAAITPTVLELKRQGIRDEDLMRR